MIDKRYSANFNFIILSIQGNFLILWVYRMVDEAYLVIFYPNGGTFKQEGILIVRKRFPLIIRILSTFIQLFCWMLLRSIDMLQSKIKKRHLKG